jgi:hypothetical protein
MKSEAATGGDEVEARFKQDGVVDTDGKQLERDLGHAASEAAARMTGLVRGERYLLAARGEGSFIGETPLIGGVDVRQPVSVRAYQGGDVTVAEIPYGVARKHFKAHPLAKQRLAEIVWKRQSEIIVMESLLRLAAVEPALSGDSCVNR